jgi:hypothetical protein
MNESDLILDPEVRSRLEQALGIEVPDPNSLEFQELLEELQENHPEMFEEVMRNLTVNVSFPAEQQANKAARRESFYALVTRLFFRRSQVDGEPVAAKRRWLMYLFGALALLGPGLYILGQTFGNRTPAQEPTPEMMEVDPGEPVQPSTPLTAQVLPVQAPAKEDTPPPPPVQPKQTTQLPPAPTTPPPPTPKLPAAPQAAPVQAKEPEEVRPNSLTMFQNQVPLPTQLSMFDNKAAKAEAAAALTLFTDDPASETLLLAELEDTPAENLTISTESPTGQTRPTQMRLGESPEAQTAPTTLEVGQEAAAQETLPLTELTTEQPGTDGEATTGEIVVGDLAATGPKVKTLTDILPPGSRVAAQLTTGVAVVQGAITPIVAKSGPEWCTTPPCSEITWLGEATLDVSNRVQIRFTQAVYKDSVQTISALALGAGDTPGLTASVKDTAPSLAQDLLRSAASGVSDYIGVLGNQKKVTIVDGVTIAQSEAPPLDLFLLGKMGSLFNLPQNSTPVVRIAEVPVNSQLVVLYGVTATGVAQPVQDPASLQDPASINE